mmetsp:Transcript_20514/g.50325  ORF Transcript_20514/g.50325 Transcript_20514/m.50325 type:complete len:103 (-) Transcript_20514:771-1079(-)
MIQETTVWSKNTTMMKTSSRNSFSSPHWLVRWADPFPKRCVLSVACDQLFMVVAARDYGFGTTVYSAGHNGFGQLGQGDLRKERHELTSIKDLERKLISKVQ